MGRRRTPGRQRALNLGRRSLTAALGLCLLGPLACDGDNAATPPEDMMPDAEVVTGRPDFGPVPAPAPPADVQAFIDAFGGAVGFYAVDLDSAEAMGHEEQGRFAAGGLSALFAVMAYAAQVEAGAVLADRSVQIRPADVRGKGLGPGDAGSVFTLSALAARALDGDRTAEHVLVQTIGGPEAVDAVIGELGIDGIGRYLDPCARDRLYAEALDARFGDVACDDLGLWLYGGVATGLTPAPFPSPPTFTDEQRIRAADGRVRAEPGTITARALARMLALLDAGGLVTPGVDARVRGLLDGSRAAGGGDDGLPASIWSGSMEGLTEDGRHWAGRVRAPGDTSFVLVVLNGGEGDVDALTRALGAGAWGELLGGIDWPPMAPAEPGAASAQVLDVAASDACDTAPDGFEGQMVCRSNAASEIFTPGDAVTASLLAPGPGPLEAAWIWAAPDGDRVRTQRRLPASAWWVWSETRRLFDEGLWSVTISLDGEVVDTVPFELTPE